MPRWRGSASGISFDQDSQHIPLDRIGDPGLGAIDHIVVAVLDRTGANTLQVRPASGSVSAMPPRNFARRKLWQVLALHFLGGETLNRRRHDQMRIENARYRHPNRRHALYDFGVGFDVQARGHRIPARSWPQTNPAQPAYRRCPADTYRSLQVHGHTAPRRVPGTYRRHPEISVFSVSALRLAFLQLSFSSSSLAKAGGPAIQRHDWIPACAGMTSSKVRSVRFFSNASIIRFVIDSVAAFRNQHRTLERNHLGTILLDCHGF